MNKIPAINLPQSQVTQYDRALSVMLYQYLREMRLAINALLEATGVDFPTGSATAADDAVAITEVLDQQPTSRDLQSMEVLTAILVELKVLNHNLAAGFGNVADPEDVRPDYQEQ